MLDFHDFQSEEYKRRYDQARELMGDKGLDALLIGEEFDCRYFSGLTPWTEQRPIFVVLPKTKAPSLIAPRLAIDARKDIIAPHKRSWIEDIKQYSLPFSYKSVQEAIEGLDLAEAKIGAELDDPFLHFSIPYMEMLKLQNALPRAKFVDASSLIWNLRMKKSKAEISYIRESARILSESFDAMFYEMKEGMTEKDAAKILMTHMVKLGADFPSMGMHGPMVHIVFSSSRENPPIPSNKRLMKGDVVKVDSGVFYKGYAAEFARTGVVNPPSQEQMEIWEKTRKLNEKCVKMIKPGVKFGNLPIWTHGVGLRHAEPPYPTITIDGIPYKEMTIEEGMVLAVENKTEVGHDVYHLEQNVVVTEEGCEILSTARSDLYIISTV